MMINSNLRTFVTVAELGSVTEASKRLYVTQPAVSQAVRKLEDDLGVTLFVRDRRNGLSLTRAGEEILALSYRMLDVENRMYQAAYAENHLEAGIVRVATVPLGLSLVLAGVLPAFRRAHPGIEVEIMEGAPIEVKQMVLSSKSDLGITTSPYLGLDSRRLLMDRMVSISAGRAVDVDLSADGEGIVLCRLAYDSVREQLSDRRLDLSHALVVNAASTQVNLVESGWGAGVISELMLSTIPNSLARGRVTPAINVEIGLVALGFDALAPAAREFAAQVVERTA